MTPSPSVLIVGGGAAGLFCAAQLLEAGVPVTLLERNDKVGRKLGITGKGRCNLTNACTVSEFLENVPTNPRFLYSAISGLTPADTVAFFERWGVKTKVERGNRVFPVSDRAADVVNALRRACVGGQILTERVSALCTEIDDTGTVRVCGVCCESGRSYAADTVVIATGGASYPRTGSTGDGYALAESLGLAVIPPTPSLCPLETEEGWCKTLMGLSLRNVSLRITDGKGGKEVFRDFGEMLFTHFGVSGPMILSASAHLKDAAQGRYVGVIDLKPALDDKQLDSRLVRELSENPNKNYSSILSTLLPAKMVPVFARLSGIDPGKKAHAITKAERASILSNLRSLTFTVKGPRPIDEAIVTKGGVSVKELSPATMACKRVQGLYFVGEVVDLDGYTGGFNLQIAFATAAAAARDIANRRRNEE